MFICGCDRDMLPRADCAARLRTPVQNARSYGSRHRRKPDELTLTLRTPNDQDPFFKNASKSAISSGLIWLSSPAGITDTFRDFSDLIFRRGITVSSPP